MRLVERLWGSRKFLGFVLSTLPYTALIPVLLLSLVIRPLSSMTSSSTSSSSGGGGGDHVGASYLPAGPTGIIFALLAQFHSAIPHTYKYTVSTSTSTSTTAPAQGSKSAKETQPTSTSRTTEPEPEPEPSTSTTTATAGATPPSSLVLTDKSTTYFLALQLSLSQFPHSLLPAITGWTIGYAWRMDLLPKCTVAWQVPRWVYTDTPAEAYRQTMGLIIDEPAVISNASGRWSLFGHGRSGQDLGAAGSGSGAGAGAGGAGGDGGRYEGLRRRLETESRAAVAGGDEGANDAGRADDEPSRPMGRQLLNRIRGVF